MGIRLGIPGIGETTMKRILRLALAFAALAAGPRREADAFLADSTTTKKPDLRVWVRSDSLRDAFISSSGPEDSLRRLRFSVITINTGTYALHGVSCHPRPLPLRGPDYLRLYPTRPGIDAINRSEREISESLCALPPDDVVDLLILYPAPVALIPLLAAVDRGLGADRESWETSLAAGVERAAARSEDRLENLASIAKDRVKDPERRGRIADILVAEPSDDRRLALAGQFAAGVALTRLRDFFWSRVPQEGAVEALGHVMEPGEAIRLEQLGGRPEVLRALETAYARTRDPAFAIALQRLAR
jgi:hypothetical protein